MSALPDGTPRPSLAAKLRDYLLTGLLVLAPSAITIWILFRLLNWVDNLLGRFFRFEAFDYHRIPGVGLVATLLLLVIVGWMATWIGARSLGRVWDSLLMAIPGIGIVYSSTKSLGEAFVSKKDQQAFQQVVLIPWPHPGIYRIGFITGRTGDDIRRRLGDDIEVVFVPHSPNPASGFVHYVPRQQLIFLDWDVEDGLRVVVSGGVVQPGAGPPPPTAMPPRGAGAASGPAA